MKRKIVSAIAITGAGLFFACNTPARIARHYNEYKSTHREEFANDCSQNFRSEPEYIQGPETVRVDTVTKEGVPCPPPDPVTGERRCPPANDIHHYHNRVDTIIKPDAAKEAQLKLQADRFQTVSTIAKADQLAAENSRDEWEGKARKRSLIIAALCAIIGIGLILKIKKIISI